MENNNNTPARRARTVSFSIHFVPEGEQGNGAHNTAGLNLLSNVATLSSLDVQSEAAEDAVSRTRDDQSVADPRATEFQQLMDRLVDTLALKQSPTTQGDQTEANLNCVEAMNAVSAVLEKADEEYDSNPVRCPLVNVREDFPIGNMSKSLVQTLFMNSFDTVLWDYLVQPQEGVSEELRIAAARLCLIIIETQTDVAESLAQRDMNPEDLQRAVLLSPRGELRTYQTGILSVLLNDRKSHDMADMCVVPCMVDDPTDSSRRIPLSLPRELSKRLSQEIAPLLEQNQWSPEERNEIVNTIRCLAFMGEYHEALEPALEYNVLGVIMSILRSDHVSEKLLFEAFELCSRLIAHRTFADRFVTEHGVEVILEIAQKAPRPPYLYPSIGWCLSGIGSMNPIMERVLRSDAETTARLVEFELLLLRGDQDLAKKNALSFFAHAFAFPAVLAQFDQADGCRTLLNILSNPSAPVRTIVVMNLLKHTVRTLREYFRAHVAQMAHVIRNTKFTSAASATTGDVSGGRLTRVTFKRLPQNKPLSLDTVTHNKNIELLSSRAQEVASFLQQTKWRPVEELLQYRTDDERSGIALLLGLIRGCQREIGQNAEETEMGALQVLAIASILPITIPEICLPPTRLPKGYFKGTTKSGQAIPANTARVTERSGDISTENTTGATQTTTTTTTTLPADANATGSDGTGGNEEEESDEEEDDDEADEDDEDEDSEDGFSVESGIGILLRVASSDISAEEGHPKSLVAALITLSNCLCSDWSGQEHHHGTARALARNNNAVMILMALLNYKESPGDADPIRFFACDALFGLSHDPEVADLLKALNVDRVLAEIANSEPVVAENRAYHLRLKRKALQLLHIISPGGRDEEIALAADAAARKIARDAIVRRSNVQWSQKELMQIIHEHLEKSGCINAARALALEAGLAKGPGDATPRASSIALPRPWPCRPSRAGRRKSVSGRRRMLRGTTNHNGHHIHPRGRPHSSSFSNSARKTPHKSASSKAPIQQQHQHEEHDHASAAKIRVRQLILPPRGSTGGTGAAQQTQSTLGEEEEAVMQTQSSSGSGLSLGMPPPLLSANGKRKPFKSVPEDAEVPEPIKRMRLEKSVSLPPATTMPDNANNAIVVPVVSSTQLGPSSHPTMLERMVREHLRHQHQTCRNPVTTPAPFNLLDPHKKHVCVEAKPKTAPRDTVGRMLERQVVPVFGGPRGRQLTTRSIHAKAKYSKQYSYGLSGEDLNYSCLSFRGLGGRSDQILIGTESGIIHKYRTWTTEYAGAWDIRSILGANDWDGDDFALTGLGVSSDGSHFLTRLKQNTTAIVWRTIDEADIIEAFRLEDSRAAILDPNGDILAAYIKGSGLTSTSANNAPIGSNPSETSGIALYNLDSGTDRPVVKLYHPEGYKSNGYRHTNLSMTARGAMVCYDGVLWDARRMNRPIHKFDKLSEFGWSALHPNGIQIVLDKDVWDLRTNRIVQSCSNALHASSFSFDPAGEVIYSYQDAKRNDIELPATQSAFNKSVVVTDALDYSNIASYNVDRPVFDLAVHPDGGYVAVVVQSASGFEADCRLYEIGRAAPDEDDADFDDAQIAPDDYFQNSGSEEGDESDDEVDGDFDDEDEFIVNDFGGQNAMGNFFMRVLNAGRGGNLQMMHQHHHESDHEDEDEDEEEYDEEEDDGEEEFEGDFEDDDGEGDADVFYM